VCITLTIFAALYYTTRIRQTVLGINYAVKKIEANGLNFAVGHWPGGDQHVFCIHGLTANHLAWQYQAQALQAAGYTVWAMDLRGRGGSDKPLGTYGPEVHAADAAVIISSLGIAPVALLGHSLGALVSVHFAANYPNLLHHLVLYDGGGVLNYSQASLAIKAVLPSVMRLGKTYPNKGVYLETLRKNPLAKPWTQVWEDYYSYELVKAEGGVRCNIPKAIIEAEFQAQGGSLSKYRALVNVATKYKHVKQRLHVSRNPPYGKVQVPVLIIKAGHYNYAPGDEILPDTAIARMQREMPHARKITIANTNHYTVLMSENPDREKQVIDFLQG